MHQSTTEEKIQVRERKFGDRTKASIRKKSSPGKIDQKNAMLNDLLGKQREKLHVANLES